MGTFLRLSGAVLAGIFLGQVFALLTGYDDYILLAVGTVLGVALWNMLCQVQIFHSSRAAFRGLRSLSCLLYTSQGRPGHPLLHCPLLQAGSEELFLP